MQIHHLLSVALLIGLDPVVESYVAHGAVVVVAAVLCSISLYAWSRRRHSGLLLVSLAFFVFCLKEVFWILSTMYGFNTSETGEFITDLISNLTELIALGLFFVAIIRRPRKQLE